ncbi:hypothetical protein DKZ34_04000 [Limosilactobacillus reuteri]|uniref:crAss001_48 related protein n=1 Tax=Limosilactobacillus reuteri TaxID=1598 RepID=UPI000D6F80F1|nr:hypothetical protein [Limosilactobacillus reuteri]PWT41018.1 hypothetical protein DKZ34_04000 [Limosilactobacillus reuteri]
MTNTEIHTEKLNVELFELENKMKKLQEFIDSDDFLRISTIDQMLLGNQMVGMAMYRNSLNKRLKLAMNKIKYTVQVLPQSNGYLNRNRREQVWYLLPNNTVGDYQTHFTQSEIDEMKENPFFAAIDWDNVKIEPVEE